MVRSILFTGDCAAARAVHEKKMEERRLSLQGAAGCCPDEQTPGHGSAATPARSEPAVALHSKSRLRKSTGTGTYAASANPVKKEINEYLACLASRQGPDTWVLALETRDLLTVASLVAVGFHPGRIVVPNPDRWEVEAMHVLCPELVVMEATSHELLQALEDDSSLSHARLRALGWPGFFGFVWLDYCGSFASGAGRQRQGDILALLRSHMLARPGRGALLAVTLSQRGSPKLYSHDLVDALVLLVRHLAESHGFVARTLSVCSYKISAPMYTVAFRVCGALPLLDTICISAVGAESSGIVDCERSLDTHVCDGDGSQSKAAASVGNRSELRERVASPERVAGPRGKQTVFIPGEWRILQGLDDAPSHGAVAAARRVAAVFARYVRLHTAPGSFSLVQDGKLLHVASALLVLPAPTEATSQQEPACACAAGAWVGRVVVALADPLDTMLAQHVVSQSLDLKGVPDVKQRLVLVPWSVHEMVVEREQAGDGGEEGREDEKGERGRPGQEAQGQGAVHGAVSEARGRYASVWLGYDAARELRQCHAWQDLGDVLNNGILDLSGGSAVLGVCVNFAPNGEIWRDSAVDWLSRGVEVAAARAGLMTTLAHVFCYVRESPRMALIFILRRVAVESGSLSPILPSEDHELEGDDGVTPALVGWREFRRWERDRDKLPVPAGVKYLKISAYVTALVELVQSTNAREGVAKKASGVNGGPEARADIILHEPGFLHLLPVLSQSLGSRARIVCLADDFLQVDHLDRLGYTVYRMQASSQPARRKKEADASGTAGGHQTASDALQGAHGCQTTQDTLQIEESFASARCLLLVEDRGLPSWHQTWCDRVKAWLAVVSSAGSAPSAACEGSSSTRPSRIGLLVMMAEQTNKSGIATIEGELQEVCHKHHLECVADTKSSVVCESRDFFFGCYFVGGAEQIRDAQAAWQQSRPPFTLHPDCRKIKC